MKTLIFEGAGWPKAESSADVGNCRIRTRLRNDEGRIIYLEIFSRTRWRHERDIPFEIPAFVPHCFERDANERSEWRRLEHGMQFNYTAAELLKWVNINLRCSFTALEVQNDGVRVHDTTEPLC